jgi:histidine triad (HIT) family protein
MDNSTEDKRTIFDRILSREAPADIVFENEYVLAFRDINPQAPVHVLVIPKRRINRFEELADRDPEEIGRFILGIVEVVRQLQLPDSGYRVVINNGKHGQQSVDYLHAHILGGRQMTWPPG